VQIWLGNVNAARDLQGLLNVGVTHILNCAAQQCPDFYPQVRVCKPAPPVCARACSLLPTLPRSPIQPPAAWPRGTRLSIVPLLADMRAVLSGR